MGDHPFLNRVVLLGAGIEVVDRTDAQDAPKLLCFVGDKDGVRSRVGGVAMGTHDSDRSGIHVELPDLLLQRHAAQQIIEALFGRSGGLAVDNGALLLRKRGSRTEGDEEAAKKKAGR